MPIPQADDILIRSLLLDRFELVDVVSVRYIGAPCAGFPDAVDAARAKNPRAIWHQNAASDNGGRAVKLVAGASTRRP